MSALVLIAEAEAQGITLSLQHGAIAWQSNQPPPDELLAELAAHKSEIVIALTPTNCLLPLSSDENHLVNAWLDLVDEKEPAQRLFVLQRCASNPVALCYVQRMASDAGLAVAPLTEPWLRPATQTRPSILETVYDLPLLPDDKQFLSDLLHGKTLADKSVLLQGYRRQWDEASAGETLDHRRDNAGRRAANTWIRRNTTGCKSPQGHSEGC